MGAPYGNKNAAGKHKSRMSGLRAVREGVMTVGDVRWARKQLGITALNRRPTRKRVVTAGAKTGYKGNMKNFFMVGKRIMWHNTPSGKRENIRYYPKGNK